MPLNTAVLINVYCIIECVVPSKHWCEPHCGRQYRFIQNLKSIQNISEHKTTVTDSSAEAAESPKTLARNRTYAGCDVSQWSTRRSLSYSPKTAPWRYTRTPSTDPRSNQLSKLSDDFSSIRFHRCHTKHSLRKSNTVCFSRSVFQEFFLEKLDTEPWKTYRNPEAMLLLNTGFVVFHGILGMLSKTDLKKRTLHSSQAAKTRTFRTEGTIAGTIRRKGNQTWLIFSLHIYR